MKKELCFKFGAPLNAGDSECQTYGCRQNNPEICGNNGLEGVCAFSSEDKICKRPSRAWAKKYKQLKQLEENKNV